MIKPGEKTIGSPSEGWWMGSAQVVSMRALLHQGGSEMTCLSRSLQRGVTSVALARLYIQGLFFDPLLRTLCIHQAQMLAIVLYFQREMITL